MSVARILSARMFYGDPVVGYDPVFPADWSDRRPDVNQIRAILARAAGEGYTGLLTVSDLRVLQALTTHGTTALPVIPVIPNVSGYIRDAVDYGLVGAGLRRLSQLSLPGMLGVGLVGVQHAVGVLKKEFSALLKVLFEAEMAAFRRFRPLRTFLSPQITDLAVAFDHGALVALFIERMRRRYRTEPGLATHNPLLLLERLTHWCIEPPPLLAPVNRRGYLMQPDPLRWAESIRTQPLRVIADVVGVGTVPGDEDENYLATLGIREMVVEVDVLAGASTQTVLKTDEQALDLFDGIGQPG